MKRIDLREKRGVLATVNDPAPSEEGEALDSIPPQPPTVAATEESAPEAIAESAQGSADSPNVALAEGAPSVGSLPEDPTPQDFEEEVAVKDEPESIALDPEPPDASRQAIRDTESPGETNAEGPEEVSTSNQAFDPAPVGDEDSSSTREVPRFVTLREPLGMGINERIEEACNMVLQKVKQIEQAISSEGAESKAKIATLESTIRKLTSDIETAVADREASDADWDRKIHQWHDAYNAQKDHLELVQPYASVFQGALPAWISIHDLDSLVNESVSSDDQGGSRSNVIWKIIPNYIRLFEELSKEPIAPRGLTNATEAFSEAVCSTFDNSDDIHAWHERANERLKEKGYSFALLAVGSTIDVGMVTGSIQGKTRIATVRRMALLKDDGTVISKAHVTGE